jgi:hypothetical protein
MAISARTRKLLWGKAGNRCSICNCRLSQVSETSSPEAVIGDEAHIVARQPGGARYEPLSAHERDGYDNLILLCPNHHRVIDTQAADWSVDRLKRCKIEHEARIARLTDSQPSRGPVIRRPTSVELIVVAGGKQLLEIVSGAYESDFDYDPPDDEAELAMIKSLLGYADNLVDIGNDLDAGRRVEVAYELSGLLREAMEAGFVMYGRRVSCTAEINQETFPWPSAVLRVRRIAVVVEEQAAQRRQPD